METKLVIISITQHHKILIKNAIEIGKTILYITVGFLVMCPSFTIYATFRLNINTWQPINLDLIYSHRLTWCTTITGSFNLISEEATLRLWFEIVPPRLYATVHTHPLTPHTDKHTQTHTDRKWKKLQMVISKMCAPKHTQTFMNKYILRYMQFVIWEIMWAGNDLLPI